MINYLKSMVYTLSIILVSTVIITIFNYFNLLNGLPLRIISFLIPMISVFIGSFLLGRVSSKKGYLEGLKYGGIWVALLLLLNIIMKNINFLSIIFYISILLVSLGGSILGINKRKAN